ncbi:unnamed protein product [Rhizoctonia solani]|uniref:Tc1-like transposase DDE domain-containing protein n=1 Tax=Rhizoctonia solani TaxID=456999 RepID=A0A8H3HKR9_9AGAM|nr:unnamed protein product [Rhizoctonia solani]
MPARTPNQIRAIVIRLLDQGHSVPQTAELTGLTEHTIRAIRQEWSDPTLINARKPSGVLGRPRTLDLGNVWFMTERIHQTPSLYLSEIQEELANVCGVNPSLGTISKTIKRCGITRKKMEKHAKERSEPRRIEYWQHIYQLYNPEQLVTVDESSIDLRTTERQYGYAPLGSRAVEDTPFDRGLRYSILPAMSLDGILALRVIEGSFTTESFKDFIELLLTKMSPYPGPNSVIVMDNARIHRCQETLEMIEAHGMRFIFLPAYSPDCTPIELAFSKIKSSIQRDGDLMRLAMIAARTAEFRPRGDLDYVDPDVLTQIYQHVYSVTASDARGWFRHCNYDVE